LTEKIDRKNRQKLQIALKNHVIQKKSNKKNSFGVVKDGQRWVILHKKAQKVYPYLKLTIF
jgi:hypothetical protein